MLVSLLDCNLNYCYCSSTVPPLTPEDVYGKPPWHFVPLEQQDAVKTRLARCFALGESQRYWVDSLINGTTITWYVRAERIPSGVICIGFILPEEAKTLTAENIDFLRQLAAGASLKQIAANLGIDPSSATRRRRAIERKLQIYDAASLLKLAIAMS
jgi:DNA-binding CsgD family transcriptional regulator